MKSKTLYSSLPLLENHKTWVEIDLGALADNFTLIKREIRKTSPDTRLVAVVKADAYGHGADECVKALAACGCDFFAVSSIEEAIAVRTALDSMPGTPAKPRPDILILGITLASQAPILAKYDIIQALTSFDYAKSLADCAKRAGVKVRAHIKIDTGMNRVGFPLGQKMPEDALVDEICGICREESLKVEGMFTHFARADEEFFDGDTDTTGRQFKAFMALYEALCRRGVKIGMLHVCNSAASLRFPTAHLGGVRLGIVLYGASPSEFVGLDGLRPVMSLNTVISHIHKVSRGDQISYGGVYTAETEREIATLPIGYADGFLRAYSGARVKVMTSAGERYATVVGKICMDQCMIDVSGIGAKVGDRVVLFGKDRKDLASLAYLAGTIEYECLCLISSRVPRIYKP